MCDEFSSENKTSKVMTSSLPSLPFNTNQTDLSQFNYQYSVNLTEIPINEFDIETSHTLNDKNDTKRAKHRLTERIRHKKIIELINQLSEKIGVNEKHETQSIVLTRTARYALFLSYVVEKLEKEFDEKIETSFDDWLSEMCELYRKANETVSLISYDNMKSTQNKLNEKCVKSEPVCEEVFQTPPKEYSGLYKRETLLKTPDHCLPLKKRQKMIMFSDFQD